LAGIDDIDYGLRPAVLEARRDTMRALLEVGEDNTVKPFDHPLQRILLLLIGHLLKACFLSDA
jgi:hypothetical protein